MGSTARSRNSFVAEHLPAILTKPSLPPLMPPAPPRFPTLFELAGESDKPESRRDKGIYEALIGDPLVLFRAVLDSPSCYEDGVGELLQDLMYRGTRLEELPPEQLDLLNRAAIEFATGKAPAPPAPKPRTPPPRPPREVELIHNDRGPHIPDAEVPEKPPTFWWRG